MPYTPQNLAMINGLVESRNWRFYKSNMKQFRNPVLIQEGPCKLELDTYATLLPLTHDPNNFQVIADALLQINRSSSEPHPGIQFGGTWCQLALLKPVQNHITVINWNISERAIPYEAFIKGLETLMQYRRR